MLRNLLYLFFAALISAGSASAERRIALIIGNGAYSNVTSLANPAADATLMAETVEALGFETTLLVDADQNAMKRGIATFGRSLREAERDAVGLFYYAGHGVQAQARNYLIPVEAAPTDQADLDLVGVEANWVLRQMASAGNITNIVILDACRNNPFVAIDRGVSQGLARMDAPTGSYIAYATAPGDVALDGDGDHSPFTEALANGAATPGIPIEQLFKQVRIDVLEKTAGRQTPWVASSLVQDFYFNRQAPEEAVEPVELGLWNSARESGDPGRLALFLQVYPNSRFAANARTLLTEALAKDPTVIIGQNKAEPKPAPPVAAAVEEPEPAPLRQPDKSEEDLIATAQAEPTLENYEAYVAAYPDGVFAALARAEIDHLSKAAAEPATASQDTGGDRMAALTFGAPISGGAEVLQGRSLQQLATSAPAFPPFEGLDEALWKGQSCSNCHNWTKDALCTQGGFYVDKDPAFLIRIKHPFGGAFKQALSSWAGADCP